MRKLAWFACGFALAALCSVYMLPVAPIWVGLSVALAGIAMLFLRVQRLNRLIAVLLGLGFGLAWTAGYYHIHIAPAIELADTTQGISGNVCSYAKNTDYGAKVDILLEYDGKTYRTLLFLDQQDLVIKPGDAIQTQAKLEMANYTFSQEHNVYYRSLGYILVAYAEDEPVIESAEHLPLAAFPAWISKQLRDKIDSLFPKDTVPFMKALLAGDRSGLTYSVKNDLSLAGVSHVVAISGMHVSMLLAAILFFFRRRSLAAVIGIPVVVFYMVMTGASPSVVRASLMQILLLLAPLVKREEDMPTSLCGAMLVILLINPWSVADLSFQLSFSSMAGLLLFAQQQYTALDKRFPHQNLPMVLRQLCAGLKMSVSTTLSAMIFTTPLVACSFGVVSLLSIFANFLTLWAISICFQLGMLICLLGFISSGPAAILAHLLSWIVRYFQAVTSFIAKLPFAAVYTDSGYIVLWLIFAYALLAVFLCCKKKNAWIFAACLLVSLGICSGFSVLENRQARVQTTVLDVGQGQCVLLEWDNTSIMVDCGGSNSEEAGETASRCLLGHGRRELDILVLTHFDEDHAGGIPHLMQRIKVNTLYLPPAEEDNTLCRQIVQTAIQNGIRVQTVSEDLEVCFGQSCLQIFSPVSYQPGNDGGLSVLCSRESYDILITGDMSLEAERRLLQLHALPKIELMLAGHHGAATSNSSELLETVLPDIVVISVGAENHYGHPTQEVLDRLKKIDTTVYRTDQNSTVTIRR